MLTHSLSCFCSQVGDVDSASEWLEEAEGAGVPPDSNAVFALAKLCFQFRRFSKAGLLLRGAVEQGRRCVSAPCEMQDTIVHCCTVQTVARGGCALD